VAGRDEPGSGGNAKHFHRLAARPGQHRIRSDSHRRRLWRDRLPAIFVGSEGLGRGAEGAWLGMCIAFGATSLLLWQRFAADLKRLTKAP
jgi:hypothetical protein